MGALRGGVAVIDISPPHGLLLSGFAARSEPATGLHDPLTVRAVVLGDTAIVVADVIGIHEDMSCRIRERCSLPAANVIVAATHTHGAPSSMAGRLGGADSEFLKALEDGCVAAINSALAGAEVVTISAGNGPDPDVGHNRRHVGGTVDSALPVVRLQRVDGSLLAMVVSYACHPTVLGADNRLMTADFPHFLRSRIEADQPGAVAVFVNGCTGDVNIGHTAQASWTLAAQDTRTFENARRLGERIADAALAASCAPMSTEVAAAEAWVDLQLEQREGDLADAAEDWRAEAETAEPLRRILLEYWIGWAEANAGRPPGNWTGRVSLLDWGGMPIVALPGEIFAETSLAIRRAMPVGPAMVMSYADGTPGYIPPASEYQFGGYEVDEAHRFIGLLGAFASGSAERLVDAATALLSTHYKSVDQQK